MITLFTILAQYGYYGNGYSTEATHGGYDSMTVIGFLILLVCASFYMVSTLKKGEE